ncbi:hypothetical protein, partial [Dokdonella soli]
MKQFLPSVASRHVKRLCGSPLVTLVGKTSFALLVMFQLAATASAAQPAATTDSVFSDGFDVASSPPPPPSLVSQPCVPSGLGIDYQV